MTQGADPGVAPALLHWVEEAVDRRGDGLYAAFPGCFDGERLCGDAAELARGVDPAAVDEADHAAASQLSAEARKVLRLAYVSTLAVLAAMLHVEGDPDAALESLEQLAEEEEDEFEELVGDTLEPLERALAGQETPARRGATGRAWLLVATAAPALELIISRAGISADPVGGQAGRTVLWGVARVGLVLAALRWLARGAVAAPDEAEESGK